MSQRRLPSHLAPVFAVVFIDLLGFGIVIPILPYYAKTFGADGWDLGILMASFSFFQFLFGPIWGHLSDRFGRKRILLLTVIGTSIGYALVGIANSLTALLLSRSISGIFSANLSAAQAMVSESTQGEARARALGLVGAALGMGFLLGPPLGGALSHWGYSAPLYFAAALALINALFIWKKVQGFGPKENAQKRVGFLHSLRIVSAAPTSLLAIGLYFFFTLALTQMEVSFALSLEKRFGIDALGTGLLMTAMGITMAIMQMRGVRWARARWNQSLCIAAGLGFFGVGLAFMGVAPALTWVGVGILLAAVGQSLLQPNLSAAASDQLPPENHGLAYGAYQSAGSLARIVGPLTAGSTLAHASTETPFFTGTLILGTLLILWFVPSQKWSPNRLFSLKS
jgi:MFS family permease